MEKTEPDGPVGGDRERSGPLFLGEPLTHDRAIRFDLGDIRPPRSSGTTTGGSAHLGEPGSLVRLGRNRPRRTALLKRDLPNRVGGRDALNRRRPAIGVRLANKPDCAVVSAQRSDPPSSADRIGSLQRARGRHPTDLQTPTRRVFALTPSDPDFASATDRNARDRTEAEDFVFGHRAVGTNTPEDGVTFALPRGSSNWHEPDGPVRRYRERAGVGRIGELINRRFGGPGGRRGECSNHHARKHGDPEPADGEERTHCSWINRRRAQSFGNQFLGGGRRDGTVHWVRLR